MEKWIRYFSLLLLIPLFSTTSMAFTDFGDPWEQVMVLKTDLNIKAYYVYKQTRPADGNLRTCYYYNIGMAEYDEGKAWIEYDYNPLFEGECEDLRYSWSNGVQTRIRKRDYSWPNVIKLSDIQYAMYFVEHYKYDYDVVQYYSNDTHVYNEHWVIKMAFSENGFEWNDVSETNIKTAVSSSSSSNGPAPPSIQSLYALYKNSQFEIFYIQEGRLYRATSSDGLNFVNQSIDLEMQIMQIPEFPLPGEVLWQSGGGFTPNSTVTIHTRKADGSQYSTKQVPVGDDGQFTTTYNIPQDAVHGTYTWWAVDGPTGTVSNVISYTIGASDTLVISNPSTDSMITAGNTLSITWSSAGIEGNVSITISRDGGETWSEIESSWPNQGSYDWIVEGPSSDNCLLKITPLSDPSRAAVAGPFAIVSPVTIERIAVVQVIDPDIDPDIHLVANKDTVVRVYLNTGENGSDRAVTAELYIDGNKVDIEPEYPPAWGDEDLCDGNCYTVKEKGLFDFGNAFSSWAGQSGIRERVLNGYDSLNFFLIGDNLAPASGNYSFKVIVRDKVSSKILDTIERTNVAFKESKKLGFIVVPVEVTKNGSDSSYSCFPDFDTLNRAAEFVKSVYPLNEDNVEVKITGTMTFLDSDFIIDTNDDSKNFLKKIKNAGVESQHYADLQKNGYITIIAGIVGSEVNLGKGTAGYTYKGPDWKTIVVQDRHMKYNTENYSLEQILAHEAGHCFFLGDTYSNESTSEGELNPIPLHLTGYHNGESGFTLIDNANDQDFLMNQVQFWQKYWKNSDSKNSSTVQEATKNTITGTQENILWEEGDRYFIQNAHDECGIFIRHKDLAFNMNYTDSKHSKKPVISAPDWKHYGFMGNAGVSTQGQTWVEPNEYKTLCQSLVYEDPGIIGTSMRYPQEILLKTMVLVSGSIDRDLIVSMDPLKFISSYASEEDTENGDYAVLFLDASGNELKRKLFNVEWGMFSGSGYVETHTAPFLVFAEFPQSCSEIRIVSLTTGTTGEPEEKTLFSRVSPAANPTVTLVSPNGGESVNGNFTVSWTGSHATEPLSYSVYYSKDGGANYSLIVSDLQETSIELDFDLFSGGSQCLIKVTASDGFNQAEDTSDAPFAVSDKAPVCAIISPDEGRVLASQEEIFLTGSAFDHEDGALDDTRLQWQSSLDGHIATGDKQGVHLSEGVHTITLTVTDSQSQTATAYVTITVGDRNQIPVAVAGPNQTVFAGDQVTLGGSLSYDPNDDPITYNWRQTRGPEVVLSDVHSVSPVFTVPNLQENVIFEFELTVSDGTHTSDADSVHIEAWGPITLTYTAGPNGSISGPSPQTVSFGQDGSEVTAVPDNGYRFLKWSDGRTDNPRTDTGVTLRVSVTALFERLETTCAPPSDITVPPSDDDGSYTVSWGASITAGVNYLLEEATDSGFTSGLRTAYSGTATSAAITGRTSGLTYYYRVKATRSGYTDSAWQVGSNGCAVTITLVAGTPSSITIPATDSDGSYTVSWGASSTASVTYVLEEATNPTFTSGLRVAYSGTATSTSITGRSNGVTYYYRVKATRSGYTDSAWQTGSNGCAVTITVVAGTPPNITVPASDADGSYTVSWGASSTADVTYILEESTNSNFTSGLRLLYTGSTTSASITGRSIGVTYYYRVKATRSGYTDSAWRTASNGCAVTITLVADTPSSITVPATDSDGSYTVSWGASSTAGVTYIVEEATDSGFTSGLRTAYSGAETSALVTDRSDGVTYYYRVKAIREGYTDSGWIPGLNGCSVEQTSTAGAKGDVDGDGLVGIADAVLALQVATHQMTTPTVYIAADVDADATIGLAEAVFVLQIIAETRQAPPTPEDVNGFWEFFTKVDGDQEENGPYYWQITKSGNTCTIDENVCHPCPEPLSGFINGSVITIMKPEVSIEGTMGNGTIEGTWSDTETSEFGTWRAVKTEQATVNCGWESGWLGQTSNIGLEMGISPNDRLVGTMLYTGSTSWNNYSYNLKMRNHDDDGVDIIFRFQDVNNYYVFQWEKTTPNMNNYATITKIENGLGYLISDVKQIPYDLYSWQNIRITVNGNNLKLYVNGNLEFDVNDDTFSQGAIGVGCNWNEGAFFDDVTITDLTGNTLFSDNFDDGNRDGWTAYDDPNAVPDEGPGCWFVTGGSSNNQTFTNSLGMTFNLIPAGAFTMGSPTDEPGRDGDETQHQVTLTKSYYMQTTEVTQGQWRAVMGSNPSSSSSCGDDCPVEQVSWNDIQSFLTALNNLGQGTYRLPTEAEWEYAARAVTTTAFNTGDCLGTDQANYEGSFPQQGCPPGVYRGTPVPVGSFAPNAWGLYDMHGNVWEWCQDWYGTYPTGAVTDTTGPASGSNRVLRGGSWGGFAWYCRSANRINGNPALRNYACGFRLVCLQVP